MIATAHRPAGAGPRRRPSSTSSRRLDARPRRGVRLRTHTGLDVDLRIVAPDQFGNLLQHFTGSKQHNMALRDAAVRRGLHVSEYGVPDDATGETHRCATEAEVYALLGLAYIEPELRENRGELEAAATRDAARSSIERRATCAATCTATPPPPTARPRSRRWPEAARDAGYEYLAITDHSASVGVGAGPLDGDQLRAPHRRDPLDRGRRADAARRLRGQHPPRRLARLRRRDCSPSSTG